MSIRILDPGPLTTIQDAGRRGWAHVGVPRAGFLDAGAATLANRLVGNDDGAALLETTVGGVSFVTRSALTFCVSGARSPVWAGSRALPLDEAVTVTAGTTVVVGPATTGMRAYVAFAGGLDVPEVLGSRSTDTLAGIGPARPVAGSILATGTASRGGAPYAVVAPSTPAPVLRLSPGPQADWLHDPQQLQGATCVVGAASSRVGLRLLGLDLSRRDQEMESEAMVLGAVQAPPSGEAVVFLHDHPTTGGYPVVAVIDPRDLAVCAQARPGERLTLRLV